MWRALLLAYILVCGALSALVAGFAAAVLLTLFTVGPVWLFTVGPFVGAIGALAGFKLALLPAIFLGGLLCFLEIEHKFVWGALGAGTGLFIQAMIGAMVAAPGWLAVSGAFALAGMAAALTFRGVMMVLTGFSEPAGRY
ncbi:MAG TPA: hypothetical protein VMG08_03220 [Allosphingosinicella sp.]|nr:hypothetical protein [Allosphingosinicella sp.]